MHRFAVLFLLLHTSLCGNKGSDSFVVFWNVGQGQWITAVTPDHCLHFDFGGEISYWQKNKNLFLKLCKTKKNVLHLSHPDLDHYAYYPLLLRSVAQLCWQELDHTQIPAKRLTKKIPLCLDETFNAKTTAVTRLYKPSHFKNKNDSSKVYRYKNLLIPGDSPQNHEKIWGQTMPYAHEIKVLALGHHGSRTSSSDFLLRRLKNLKFAIVQSRTGKFKHPHKETLQRLKDYHIPLIKTEDWGTTAISL